MFIFADKLHRHINGFFWSIHIMDFLVKLSAMMDKGPSLKPDHRNFISKGERNFREGPVASADGNNYLAAFYDQFISGISDPGYDRKIDIWVSFFPPAARQDPDRGAARTFCPFTGVFHNAL